MKRRRRGTALQHAVLGAVVAGALLVAWPRGDDPLPGALAATAPPAGPAFAAAAVPSLAGAAAVVAAPAGDPRAAPHERVPADRVVEGPDVARWVGDLADDGIRGNGTAAFAMLCALPPGTVPALERALAARDEQQRTFAGGVLRVRCERDGGAPSERLLAVSVDALRGGSRVRVLGTPMWPLAATTLRFLTGHAAAARAPLLRALDAGDAQQRLAAAFVLAGAAEPVLAPRLVRELVPYLADNDTGGDALFAAHGLYRLGAPGLAALREWRAAVDPQGRALLELVELDVLAPPRDRATLRARAERHRVTHLYHDPVVEYDLRRSALPLW